VVLGGWFRRGWPQGRNPVDFTGQAAIADGIDYAWPGNGQVASEWLWWFFGE